MHTITMPALPRTITLLLMRTMRLLFRTSVILCIKRAPRWSCGLSYYLCSHCHRVLSQSG